MHMEVVEVWRSVGSVGEGPDAYGDCGGEWLKYRLCRCGGAWCGYVADRSCGGQGPLHMEIVQV